MLAHAAQAFTWGALSRVAACPRSGQVATLLWQCGTSNTGNYISAAALLCSGWNERLEEGPEGVGHLLLFS